MEKNSLSTSFLVSRSVSHLSKSSTCLALSLNLNDTPLTLNKGMVIANISPIHEFASIENVNCVSSDKEQLAFDSLKNCLISEPCLSLPDFSKPFALCSDASKFSLGAVLIQEDDTGFEHPVAFASRKLGPTEIKYSVCEKEALGILFAITNFKNYLYGSEFIVVKDSTEMALLCILWQRLPPLLELDCVAGIKTEGMAQMESAGKSYYNLVNSVNNL
ncbi:Retrovirus-related Pol polyprotein from transposon 297 [Araneus ventricosus]|uniref:Retrovirus-related Pol polyprotein from transposon 297 n=1 Tax=Araneus ventricosus TaxID=182803 RepID=A0A4Y2RFT0_ARAVE|nr:Retrovirus-related Pol polyprotein from transposon 297 [Araneus ventricosus]